MVSISTDDVKRLRDETGAGVMDSKRALEEAGGDFNRAKELLREHGAAAAAKRSERSTGQGLVESYIHGGRVGALVEVNCETDFVARTEEFQALVHEIAMQVVAANPLVVAADDLPDGAEGETEQLVLLEQPYIRDPGKSIRQLINETIGKTGENIQVRRFTRFELGTD